MFKLFAMALGFSGSMLIAVPSVQAQPVGPSGTAVFPRAGDEGRRDLKKLQEIFAQEIQAQPFGKKWTEIVAKSLAPKQSSGLGQAKTHPNLKFDPIELQQQSQYVTDTGVEERFGWLSLRLRRVFRYGRLLAMQVVVEPLGDSKVHQNDLQKDLSKLRTAWKDPMQMLGLSKGFALRFNQLKSKKARDRWIIEFEPKIEESK